MICRLCYSSVLGSLGKWGTNRCFYDKWPLVSNIECIVRGENEVDNIYESILWAYYEKKKFIIIWQIISKIDGLINVNVTSLVPV